MAAMVLGRNYHCLIFQFAGSLKVCNIQVMMLKYKNSSMIIGDSEVSELA